MQVLERLRAGAHVSDERFDRLFPPEVRALSARHWTPVEVARRAVELLAPEAGSAVLDVGAGAGKLCIVGALLSPAEFVGVEQDSFLVEAARAAAGAARASRARFILGSAFDLDWAPFSGIYLFNPFGELLSGGEDGEPEGAGDLEPYRRQVAQAQERLLGMPPGTRVVVYHGFGGELSAGYTRRWSGRYGTGDLELWERRPPA